MAPGNLEASASSDFERLVFTSDSAPLRYPYIDSLQNRMGLGGGQPFLFPLPPSLPSSLHSFFPSLSFLPGYGPEKFSSLSGSRLHCTSEAREAWSQCNFLDFSIEIHEAKGLGVESMD